MKRKRGFTLIEIMIVIAIIAILAVSITYISRRGAQDKAYLVRSQSEMIVISNAIKLDVQEKNVFPNDVVRALPAGIEQYIATPNDQWPTAPWPGSVYDYDNWDGGDVIQVSVRFCPVGDSATCRANANKYLKDIVETCPTDTQTCLSQADLNNWDSLSSVFFCIKESSTDAAKKCRSHESRGVTHPGYRITISSAR